MKAFNYLSIIFYFGILIAPINSSGQVIGNLDPISIFEDWFNIGIHNSCESFSDGILSIEPNEVLNSGYELPFDIELLHLQDQTIFSSEIEEESALYIRDLKPGEYSIEIHISPDCVAAYNVIILEEKYQEISVDILVTDSDHSNNCSNGSINLSINDAIYPIEIEYFYYGQFLKSIYLENPASSGEEDLSELDQGDYTIEIFDSNCKKYENDVTIHCDCLEDCNLSAVTKNITCTGNEGELLGEIMVTVNCESNHDGWTYLWHDGETMKDRINLEVGVFCLTITDEDQCSQSKCWEIIEEGIEICTDLETSDEDFCKRECRCSNGDFLSADLVPSDLGEVKYGFTRCKADVFCDGVKVGRKNKGYDQVWAFIYDNPDFTSFNFQNPCARYKVCPLDNVGWGYNNEMMRLTPISSTECIISCRPSIFSFWTVNPFFTANCCGNCEVSPIPTSLEPSSIKAVVRNGETSIFSIGVTSDKGSTYIKESNQELGANEYTQYPGTPNVDFESTENGTVYYAGDFDFHILEPFEIEYGGGSKDIFVIKYNSDGTEDWATYFGSLGNDYLNDISVSESRIYVTASMGEDFVIEEELVEVNGPTSFVFEFDIDGTLITYDLINSSQSVFGNGILEQDNGNLIAFGEYSGQLYLNDQLMSNTTLTNKGTYLTSLNQNREMVWTKSFESASDFEEGPKVKSDDQNLLILNSFRNSFQITSDGLLQSYSDENIRFNLTNLDASTGVVNWNINEGSPLGSLSAKGMIVTDNGEIIIAGHFNGQITFSNGQTLISEGQSDIFIAKYNEVGQLIWLKKEGNEASEFCTDILNLPNGEIFYSGYFEGTESTIEGIHFSSDESNHSDFLVKLQSEGSQNRIIEEIDRKTTSSLLTLDVFPNPVKSDQLNVILTTDSEEAEISIELINSTNQILNSASLRMVSGVNRFTLDLSSNEIANGLYFIRVSDKTEKSIYSKVVILKN